MFADQITPYLCKAVLFAIPDGNTKGCLFVATPTPSVLLVWMVEMFPPVPGPLSTCGDQTSMKSSSPQVGQFTVVMLVPSDQKAGHSPWFVVSGSWMLASIRPYVKLSRSCVFILVESHVPPLLIA